MFDIGSFFKKIIRPDQKELLVETTSKDAAKERLHVVLMQDRANVSADFLELMKQEIIDVIKKYIVIDEEQIDVRLTNQENEDGTNGAPSLYANIPILNIRNDIKCGILEQNSTEASNEVKTEEKSAESYDEEYDDDVTFDDLLKAAEEEEKRKNESLENTSNLEVKPEKVQETSTEVRIEETSVEANENSAEIDNNNENENNDITYEDTKEEKKVNKKTTTKKQTSKVGTKQTKKKTSKASSGKKRTLKR